VISGELVKADPFACFRNVLSRIASHPITQLGVTGAWPAWGLLFALLFGRLHPNEDLIALMMFA
jgi:hypothetical protein